ncbi:hypothetical protein DFH06DRAFT_1320538 [Mycena polygramma]|nr:hypothetical protein DFH06DRAFT_1320538 [Mycena polygramma]
MPSSPRTEAITYAVVTVLGLTFTSVMIASLVRSWGRSSQSHNLVSLALTALVLAFAMSAAYNGWKSWRVHRAQIHAALPTPAYAPAPVTPSR